MPRQNRCQNSFHVSINFKGAKGTIPRVQIFVSLLTTKNTNFVMRAKLRMLSNRPDHSREVYK